MNVAENEWATCRQTQQGRECNKCKQRFLCWTACYPTDSTDWELLNRTIHMSGITIKEFAISINELAKTMNGFTKIINKLH